MSKTKEEFTEQMHDRSFKAWWEKEECNFPLVHTSDAKKIFVAGRVKFETQFFQQKNKLSKAERINKAVQSSYDKLKNTLK